MNTTATVTISFEMTIEEAADFFALIKQYGETLNGSNEEDRTAYADAVTQCLTDFLFPDEGED